MTDELIPTKDENKTPNIHIQNTSADSVYALGLIGAWVFYFKRASTTEERVKAFFKGLVWPAFLVYELLKFLEEQTAPDDQET